MPNAATSYYSRAKLVPLYGDEGKHKDNVQIAPSLALVFGQVLSETTTPGTYTPYLAAPAAPVPTTATTGGTVLAGVYGVEISYVNAAGESVASANGPVTTTGTTSTVTIPSPVAAAGATGWYAYVTQVNGTTFTRQQTAGSPTAIGTNLVLTAPPSSSGVAPSAAPTAPARAILEYACTTDASGNITLGAGSDFGITRPNVSVYLPNSGVAYNAADLVGLDAAALTALGGALHQGTASNGIVVI